METNCCYALQNKTWVSDPDGNEWEAFVVLEDDLPTTTMCCAPGATTGATATTGAAATTSNATTPAGAAMTATAIAKTGATTATEGAETESEVSSCCATAAPLAISR
jgi:hypothetical protein